MDEIRTKLSKYESVVAPMRFEPELSYCSRLTFGGPKLIMQIARATRRAADAQKYVHYVPYALRGHIDK